MKIDKQKWIDADVKACNSANLYVDGYALRKSKGNAGQDIVKLKRR